MKTVTLFESEIALRENLIAAIKRGERCFVTCNSKKSVKVLAKVIKERCGPSIKLLAITSDNSRDVDEIEFVLNINDRFAKIQVLLCSPSLGTGIDIICDVDGVYGFFYAKVNTHTDMDQQLARVRNPKSVKAWISPARFQYSSNFDVIRDDLARARYVPAAVKGYCADDGRTEYDPNHPLLMICTHVIASQRASKNRLIELFCELRRANGWTIEHDSSRVEGNKDRSNAEKAIWNEHAKALLRAPRLDDNEFFDLLVRKESSEPLNLADQCCFERNSLERSLGVGLTYEIIKLNHDGQLPDRVETLSKLTQHKSTYSDIVNLLVAEINKPLARIQKLDRILLLQIIARVAGLSDEAGLRADAVVNVASLTAFVSVCKRNQTLLEELLGRPVRNDVSSNPVRQLNAFLMLGGLKLETIKRRKKSKKSVREYGFEQDRLIQMVSLAEAFKPLEVIKATLENSCADPGASTPIFDSKYPSNLLSPLPHPGKEG